jgi:hypothetical protein
MKPVGKWNELDSVEKGLRSEAADCSGRVFSMVKAEAGGKVKDHQK